MGWSRPDSGFRDPGAVKPCWVAWQLLCHHRCSGWEVVWGGGCEGSLCWLQFSQENGKQEGREGRWKEVVEGPSFIIINLFGGKEERGLEAPKAKQQLS